MKVTKAVAVSKYTVFDRNDPGATPPTFFNLVNLDANSEFPESWAKDGYIQVGTAEVDFTFFSYEEFTKNAAAVLNRKKQKILAEAQFKATAIDREIQSLLAITNEA